jgi:clathrin heavy chain
MLQPRLWQHATRTNPEEGAEFAAQLANDESCPLVDVERVVDIFMSQNMIQPATSFLLDALKENKQEQGHLQTCLLKMNLVRTPHKSRTPSSATRCSPITTTRITNLCEKAGLLQRVGICTLCKFSFIYKSSIGTQVL